MSLTEDHSTDDMDRDECRGLACILAWWLAGMFLDDALEDYDDELEALCLTKRNIMQLGKAWLREHTEWMDLEAQRAGDPSAFIGVKELFRMPDTEGLPRCEMEYRRVDWTSASACPRTTEEA